MNGKTRNIYPGGNTPQGFYSYYNDILPQSEAEKIFCIKGGPGVGKSTLMREVGEHFVKRGEAVDHLWCSSDPDSLDGVVLKERGVALVDGTAPHIIDPIHPGAVDELVNLGECWQEEKIRKRRSEILELNETIGIHFSYAYEYLACAGRQQKFLGRVYQSMIDEGLLLDVKQQMNQILTSISEIRRREARIKRGHALGEIFFPGKVRKYFASAITPYGFRNGLESIGRNAERILFLDVPSGYPVGPLLAGISQRLTEAGIDVEEFYCPMDPEGKLEHLMADSIGLAVVTRNEYHGMEAGDGQHVRRIRLPFREKQNSWLSETVEDLRQSGRHSLENAVEQLKLAKEYHDRLEECYIASMDFQQVGKIKADIVDKIYGLAGRNQ